MSGVDLTLVNKTAFPLNVELSLAHVVPLAFTNALEPGQTWTAQLALPSLPGPFGRPQIEPDLPAPPPSSLPAHLARLTSVQVHYDHADNRFDRAHAARQLGCVVAAGGAGIVGVVLGVLVVLGCVEAAAGAGLRMGVAIGTAAGTWRARGHLLGLCVACGLCLYAARSVYALARRRPRGHLVSASGIHAAPDQPRIHLAVQWRNGRFAVWDLDRDRLLGSN